MAVPEIASADPVGEVVTPYTPLPTTLSLRPITPTVFPVGEVTMPMIPVPALLAFCALTVITPPVVAVPFTQSNWFTTSGVLMMASAVFKYPVTLTLPFTL
jgi:hypothetical protein